jgi:G3E family GTPase
MRVPVTVVTGALGVGKTTAILGALQTKPADQRWAVLVNEFGAVGVDGPVFTAAGVSVREVAGGCICCTAGLELSVGLVRLLREIRPDRLFIEPSGAARPAAVIDALRAPGLRDAVERRAVITLVDPRQFMDLTTRSRETYAEQVQLGDILVGQRADERSASEMDAFTLAAAALEPAKLVVATTSFGALDPGWFDLAPAPTTRVMHALAHAPEVEGRGWIWPDTVVIFRPARPHTNQQQVKHD